MSLAVVRCPACRGASRVSIDSLGHMVGCPRCQVPFVAEEEIPVVQPAGRASAPPAPRPVAVVPVAPPRRRRPREERYEPPAEYASPDDSPEIPDPEHDPHLPPVAGLPVSVLVGFALLPFAIPLLWWAAPAITGQPAALSLGVPVSLAIAASALCLGVVYTIDWTAATRIKGVLMLLGLAYASATGLYFLNKDIVDRLQRLGGRAIHWHHVESKEGKFKVRMPGPTQKTNEQPLPQVAMTGGWAARYTSDIDDRYNYFAAAGRVDKEPSEPDEWFQSVGDHLKTLGPVTDNGVADKVSNYRGYQWRLQVGDNSYRVVRVYLAKERVYYLSVEGRNLTAGDDELVDPFFRSFQPDTP